MVWFTLLLGLIVMEPLAVKVVPLLLEQLTVKEDPVVAEAVVATVSVSVKVCVVVVPVALKLAGLNVEVTSAGNPEIVKGPQDALPFPLYDPVSV